MQIEPSNSQLRNLRMWIIMLPSFIHLFVELFLNHNKLGKRKALYALTKYVRFSTEGNFCIILGRK